MRASHPFRTLCETGGVTNCMVPARSRNNHRGPAFFHFPDSKGEDISSWQRRNQKSARTCPAFAFPQRERNIAVSCARRRDPTKRKSPAIVAIRLARSEEPPNRRLECRTQGARSLNRQARSAPAVNEGLRRVGQPRQRSHECKSVRLLGPALLFRLSLSRFHLAWKVGCR